MGLIIRKYRRRDRHRIMEITQEAFDGVSVDSLIERGFGRVADTSWQQRRATSVDYDLEANPEQTLVAEQDGEVVGYVCARLYRQYLIGHVANLAVAPEHQGQGIGRALLEACLGAFREAGMKYARVETLDSNERGQRLYPSAGFREVARQIHYFMEL